MEVGILFEAKLSYLKELKYKLQLPAFAAVYLRGPRSHSGRPHKLSEFQDLMVITMLLDSKTMLIRTLRSRFINAYYANINDGPCHSTIYSLVVRAGLSHKQVTRRHIYRSDAEGYLLLHI